ncbi:MAG: alpha-2-macroglobulin [Candidatus Methanogaster sp.]|uniref:Alpha-2-macroglobulin n=1 Tax=Candidatus Methanogaster sp. TaxID=3386292 RepID=A0AC61L1U2_9EURY|nr:MAG: alpha-2-macroglobulin [ANME-2 cluster archaeon]
MKQTTLHHIIHILLFIAVLAAASGCIETDHKQPDSSTPIELIPCGEGVTGEGADYLILAPKMLFVGSESSISMSAFGDAHEPVERCVRYTLSDRDNNSIPLVRASTGKSGHSVARFETPEVEEGTYSLIAEPVGTGEEYTATVRISKSNPIFIETDKPIYKPGQTVHGRILLLNNNLKPVEDSVKLEIADASGIKVFRETLETNGFGVAAFDLPLSAEPNLGTWKIKAEAGESKSVVDIEVERYVLPKFEVETATREDWFLVSDRITGTVSANYFFGKPVDGSVEIEAVRYTGTWETYATYSAILESGSAEFELPAVGWIAGTYGAGGQGSLMLNISVMDTGNHTETTTELLKIVESDTILQLIPESSTVKPGLSFEVLIVTEDPDGNAIETDVSVSATFHQDQGGYTETMRDDTVSTKNGIAILSYTTPNNCTGAYIEATCRDTSGAGDVVRQSVNLDAAYSPGANFIHIAQTSDGVPNLGDTMTFAVHSTNPGTVFYDIFANGRTVYSGTSERSEIAVGVTPQMSPSAKIVAYMINPDSEVSADVLPFEVRFETSVDLTSEFGSDTIAPGDDVRVNFDARARSMIGVAIVDESVYALSAGRLNLKQVFDELEKRFMEPQIEIHPEYGGYYERRLVGTYDILDDAGMQVLASPSFEIPKTPVPEVLGMLKGVGGRNMAAMDMAVVEVAEEEVMHAPSAIATPAPTSEADGELATVERVRQFFPETWLWMPNLLTDADGRAQIDLTAPDSITTWQLHAVSSSGEGIGISEDSLTVFQDFFLDPDLPYAVTRGEVFPVRVQVYNYLDTQQDVKLTLSTGDWFETIGNEVVTVPVGANSVRDISFTITPTKIGAHTIEIAAQTKATADAVRKEIIVEAEGTKQEIVENGNLGAGTGSITLDATLPPGIVDDSGVVMVSFTPSIVAQTINGLDSLINMPFGCGEQNMIMFAPDVEVLRYLKATDQTNPEVRAKAELFIITGYQRQLTFRHNDGSFSAFGEGGREGGSLWLTAFVLDSFAGARNVTSIDDSVLAEASDWICAHQSDDGSWDSVGFVCHQEMIGGMEGRYALTGFVAIALADYGGADPAVLEEAQAYLEANLEEQTDPYPLAIASVALLKLESQYADTALEKLITLKHEDENGVYWGSDTDVVRDSDSGPHPFKYGHPPSSRNVEITSYAALALIDAKHPLANDVVKWISTQRNSLGGFSSTQDTVMALKALMTAAATQGRDIDATVTISADGSTVKEIGIDATNFDVLQTVLVPEGTREVELALAGTGEVGYQLVKRFNVILPEVAPVSDLQLNVTYNATNVAVDDVITVRTRVTYTGAADATGMMIVDVAVPTGFTPVVASLDALVADGTITRYEIAGRKVIVYVLDLPRGAELSFEMKMRALFPVKAIVPDSRAYSYYEPEVCAGAKGGELVVGA